jgi:hypothetical protein
MVCATRNSPLRFRIAFYDAKCTAADGICVKPLNEAVWPISQAAHAKNRTSDCLWKLYNGRL